MQGQSLLCSQTSKTCGNWTSSSQVLFCVQARVSRTTAPSASMHCIAKPRCCKKAIHSTRTRLELISPATSYYVPCEGSSLLPVTIDGLAFSRSLVQRKQSCLNHITRLPTILAEVRQFSRQIAGHRTEFCRYRHNDRLYITAYNLGPMDVKVRA